MRPLETLLCAAILAVLLCGLGGRNATWIRLAPLLILLVVAQVASEGARWQMAPTYVAAAILFASVTTRPNGFGSTVALVAIAVVLGCVFPVFRLPEPTGPHRIGSAKLHLVDSSRPDPHTTREDGRRELMVQIWYPTAETGTAVPYLNPAETSLAWRHLSLVHTHASSGVRPSGRFPVLLYLPSWGGGKAEATTLLEELTSHGFIVVALDHPYSSKVVLFSDGRVVRSKLRGFLDFETEDRLAATEKIAEEELRFRTADARFVLDELERINRFDPDSRFTGRLDLTSIGALGHSFGGAVAAELCRTHPRILAGADLDGLIFGEALRSGFGKPFLIFSDDTKIPPADEIQAAAPSVRRRWLYLAENERCARRGLAEVNGQYLVLNGARHSNFTDTPLFSPLKRLLPIGNAEAGPIAPSLAAEIVRTRLVSFFRNHLTVETHSDRARSAR